jgi:hypothetical protein
MRSWLMLALERPWLIFAWAWLAYTVFWAIDHSSVPIQAAVSMGSLPTTSFVSGTASQIGTTATTVLAAPGANFRIYLHSMFCGNSGSAPSQITLNNTPTTGVVGTNSDQFPNPPGFGNNRRYDPPLVFALNTAVQFTPSVANTTQICTAIGHIGS